MNISNLNVSFNKGRTSYMFYKMCDIGIKCICYRVSFRFRARILTQGFYMEVSEYHFKLGLVSRTFHPNLNTLFTRTTLLNAVWYPTTMGSNKSTVIFTIVRSPGRAPPYVCIALIDASRASLREPIDDVSLNLDAAEVNIRL